MILVGQYDSPFVRRIGCALHLYDMPFTRNTMSVFGDADQMRKINPLGRIPSLILDDGEVLIDSWAILDHLDETVGPSRAMFPGAGLERRKALRLTALAAGAVDKAGAIIYDRVLRPPESQHLPWQRRCRAQLDEALTHLEAATKSPWLLGTRMMHPDVMLGSLIWYVKARVPEAIENVIYPSLERHYARMQDVPEFAKTAPQLDEAMPSRLNING